MKKGKERKGKTEEKERGEQRVQRGNQKCLSQSTLIQSIENETVPEQRARFDMVYNMRCVLYRIDHFEAKNMVTKKELELCSGSVQSASSASGWIEWVWGCGAGLFPVVIFVTLTRTRSCTHPLDHSTRLHECCSISLCQNNQTKRKRANRHRIGLDRSTLSNHTGKHTGAQECKDRFGHVGGHRLSLASFSLSWLSFFPSFSSVHTFQPNPTLEWAELTTSGPWVLEP